MERTAQERQDLAVLDGARKDAAVVLRLALKAESGGPNVNFMRLRVKRALAELEDGE